MKRNRGTSPLVQEVSNEKREVNSQERADIGGYLSYSLKRRRQVLP